MANDSFRTHKKTKNFTIVGNELINNTTISWAAKGILIYCLSKPDGWKFYRSDIVRHATNGMDSVRGLIKELRLAGYVTLTRVIGARGRIAEWRYDVYDEPLETPVETHLTVHIDETDPSVMAFHPEYYTEDTPETTSTDSADQAAEDVKVEELKVECAASYKPHETPIRPQKKKGKTNRQKNANPHAKLSPNMAKPFSQPKPCSESVFESVVTGLKQNVEYETLQTHPDYSSWLEQWIFLCAEILASSDTAIRIGKAQIPHKVAMEQVLSLEALHFLRVKKNLSTLSHPVRNMKSYIFTSLYNCSRTLDDEIENELRTSGLI